MTAQKLGFPVLENPAELAQYQGWSQAVYEDLLAVESGKLSDTEFDDKYLATRAILVLDVTGFTQTAMHGGAISSFLRILDAQKICIPALRESGARLIHTFADDVIALFDDCNAALTASLAIQHRVAAYNHSDDKHDTPPECCIGIGFGPVYEIGPNLAMGDEMNRASVLGEDTARGGEILITENVHQAVSGFNMATFTLQSSDDLLFPYYRVTPT